MRWNLVVALLAVGLAVSGCKKSGKGAASGGGDGITLRLGDASHALPARGVRLVGVDASGKLVEYGAWNDSVKVSGDRVTGMPAGTPLDAASISEGEMAVVVVDANRSAKDVKQALATLDNSCTGYAVALGDKLGAVKTMPCPASPTLPADAEQVQIVLVAKPGGMTVALTRVNEVFENISKADATKKLEEHRKSSFFADCSDDAKTTPGEQDKPDEKAADESGGAGTAMALEEGRMGNAGGRACDILLAFDDSMKMGDVVDSFRTAIAGGFKSVRWVPQAGLPPFEKGPPDSSSTARDVSADPEVVRTKKAADDAKAKAIEIMKDTSKTVADIKKATDEAKAADDAYRGAKKAARANGEAPANESR